MLEVKDEILEGEPRYRIRDKNNNIINDDVLIEQKTPIIQEGTPLNKALFDSIKADFDSTYRNIPKGLICMWSGSEVPLGWLLCNGENGTPDLRNRFIVGAGGEYAIGDVGGSKEHTLTVNEIPAHTHNLKYANKTTNNTENGDCLGVPGAGSWEYDNDVYKITSESTGKGEAFDIRPPYYALAYIMKG